MTDTITKLGSDKCPLLLCDAELVRLPNIAGIFVKFNANHGDRMGVHVLRAADGDFSNKGVTSHKTYLQLLLNPEEYADYDPETTLVVRLTKFGDEHHLHAVPLAYVLNGKWSMNGGNYVGQSDSRFPFIAPIAVHDRIES